MTFRACWFLVIGLLLTGAAAGRAAEVAFGPYDYEPKPEHEAHNIHLCALRDIAMGVAEREDVRFADIFWPMYQAQVLASEQHHATESDPYLVAGDDGIHPGWAGHVIMAWAMLRALGLDGDLGTIEVDLDASTVEVPAGHTLESLADGTITMVSERYPFCSR